MVRVYPERGHERGHFRKVSVEKKGDMKGDIRLDQRTDLNLKEVAKKMRLSYRQIKRFAASGKLQTVKRGRERFVSVKNLLVFMGQM